MIQFLKLISSISLWLYGACIIVLLFSIRSWWMAQREKQRTIFSLEQEVAGERASRALSFAVLSLLLVGLVYYADVSASTALPGVPERSPTPNIALIFNTPTATVPPPTPTPAPPTPTPLRPQPPATATARPAPTSPPLPTSIPLPPNCPEPSARIVSPGVDAHLFGMVPIMGTVSIANFQYYKIEYGVGEQPRQFVVIGDLHRTAVVDGLLETLNVSALPPGTYQLRLTAVDRTGNFPIPPCLVRVILGE